MSPTTSGTALNQLKAMSHDIRFELLRHLARGERCICDLSDLLELPQPTVSYHLGILRDAGLIVAEQRGKNVFHVLQTPQLFGLAGLILTEIFTDGSCLQRDSAQ